MTTQRQAWRVAYPTSVPAAPSLEGLLEEGSDALPVRVWVRQDGVRTGWDDGALGFEDAAVWFSGRAFSFRIVADDVLPGTFRCSGLEAVTDVEAWEMGLPLRHARREVWVEFQLLDVHDDRRLIRGIKRMRAAQGGDGPSQYPPLSPRPGLVQPPFPAWPRILAGIGAFAALLLEDSIVPSPESRLFRAMCVISAAAFILSRRDGQATLRRIEREEAP